MNSQPHLSSEGLSDTDLFKVVKYFKDIHPSMNIREKNRVVIDNFRLIYEKDEFFLLSGKIPYDDNVFCNWAKDKRIEVFLSDIMELKKSRKKDVVSIEMNDIEFIFNYKDKEDQPLVFRCKVLDDETLEVENKITVIESILGNKIKLEESVFSGEVFTLFNISENITTERGTDKIIEMAVKRIIPYKDGREMFIAYSQKDDIGRRYVKIMGKDNKISLSQYFATI